MLHSLDPRYQYCPRVGKCVGVCQTESQCRQDHSCTKLACPLEQAFGWTAFDTRMRFFATNFDLWPVGAGEQSDSP